MKKAIIVTLLLSINYSLTNSQTFNASHGNIWTGGSFGFSTYGVTLKNTDYIDNSRINCFSLSPIFRTFPYNNFFLGPKLSWLGMHSGSSSENLWQLGGEIGCAFNAITIPYLYTSPHALISNSSYYSPESMFKLPFNAGIIIPVMKNVGFQIEAGYCLGFPSEGHYHTNSFSIGIGICGLGENTAISMVNVLSIPSAPY